MSAKDVGLVVKTIGCMSVAGFLKSMLPRCLSLSIMLR